MIGDMFVARLNAPDYDEAKKIEAEAVKLVGQPITVSQAVALATQLVLKRDRAVLYRSTIEGLERRVRRELKEAKTGKAQ